MTPINIEALKKLAADLGRQWLPHIEEEVATLERLSQISRDHDPLFRCDPVLRNDERFADERLIADACALISQLPLVASAPSLDEWAKKAARRRRRTPKPPKWARLNPRPVLDDVLKVMKATPEMEAAVRAAREERRRKERAETQAWLASVGLGEARHVP